MKVSEISYRIATWAYILVGTGHIAAELLQESNPEKDKLVQTMIDFKFEIMGTAANVYDFFLGYSLTMGLLLLGFGVLNMMLIKHFKSSIIPTNLLITNIVFSLFLTTLSIRFFFILPISLLGLATLAFAVSLWQQSRTE